MPETPPAASPVAPHFTVDDAAAAIDFYKRAFGAEELSRQTVPGGEKILHAGLLVNGGVVMLNDDFPEMSEGRHSTPRAFGGSPVTIHLTVEDVDALWTRAVAAGATVRTELADQFWGSRYGMLEDPVGHQWSLGTPQRAMSEEQMRQATQEMFSAPE